ncbi:MAG: hypothetical protein GF417_12590 [Candidatus Latescibacteria bacterium]|nr:hypothetical protein [bacterium]MBD3425266.1 hypothetical protein [Candidatus Latescibacterota bacterium]
MSGGQANNVTWRVDSIMGGSWELGTITQSNPAVYTAPDSVLSQAAVQVLAISEDDTTSCDSCSATITFNTVYVNPSPATRSAPISAAGKI